MKSLLDSTSKSRIGRALVPVIFACTLHGIVAAQSNFWEHASGYFTDGDVTQLAINSSGHLFAGTNWGIYRSTNGGDSWSHLTDGIVYSLAVAPDGDMYAYYCISNQCGLHLSTDNGDTWTDVDPGISNNPILNAIAVRVNGNVFAGGKYDVARSTDDGATWTTSTVASGDEVTTALGLASGLIFAGVTKTPLPSPYGTIRRSTDNGGTWTPFSPNWANEAINGIARNAAGYTFAATSAGIRRSTDFGATWTLTSLSGVPANSISINSVGYLFVAAGSSTSQFVNAGIYRSTDRGDSWVRLNTGLSMTNVLSIAIDANRPLYVGTTSTGVFQSIDTALTWTDVNPSLYSGQVKSLAVLQDESLMAGTLDGIFVSSDNGARWWPRNGGLQTTAVIDVHQAAGGILFAGLDGGGVARSTDEGVTWTAANSGIATQRVFSLASKPGGLVIAGTQTGVFRSTNNGDSWIAGGAGPASFARSLLTTPSGEVFAGSGLGIHLSTDDGVSWTARNNGLTNTSVGSLIRNQNGDMFAGADGFVFRSTDGAASWFAASVGLPNSFVSALSFGANGFLFASTLDSGVYVSTNNGASWRAENSGLPPFDSFFNTTSLALGHDGYLFVGTGRAFEGIQGGVFRSQQPTTWASDGHTTVSAGFSLFQNYPNPFNPTTVIRFQIPRSGSVTLKLYDVLGREVAVLANGKMEEGLHETTFDAGKLASGVYFYRLRAGEITLTRKLLLVR